MTVSKGAITVAISSGLLRDLSAVIMSARIAAATPSEGVRDDIVADWTRIQQCIVRSFIQPQVHLESVVLLSTHDRTKDYIKSMARYR
jgi:arginine exporter protein ArgO